MMVIEAPAAAGFYGVVVPTACRLQIVAMAVIKAVAAIIEMSRIPYAPKKPGFPRQCCATRGVGILDAVRGRVLAKARSCAELRGTKGAKFTRPAKG